MLRRLLRFLLPLLTVLGLLAWGAALVVNSTSRRWFADDMRSRAQLAVSGARETFVSQFERGDREGTLRVLNEISRDERIMGAAACRRDLKPLASTAGFPDEFSCTKIAERWFADEPADGETASTMPWEGDGTLRGGRVRIDAVPVVDDGRALGFVTLIHDTSYVDRREASTRRFTFAAFALLALLASVITSLVARISWRSWTTEIRRLLRGKPGWRSKTDRRDFQPILADVRELASRMAAEIRPGTAWSPDRLRRMLKRHLDGEGLIVVANREPYIHERAKDGTVQVQHPASGLVTALEPIMRACSGVWVAHGSGSADRETSDRHGRVKVPPGECSYAIRRVWLTKEEEQGYYYGFSNEGLWPLCHVAHTRPMFRSEDWAHYQRINQRFADAVCSEARTEDPIIFVQDYHYALVPRMIRERLPRATILTFWHIPWPNSERFGICPWQAQLLEGLLGSSIIGFHTQYHCNNFLETVDRSIEARIDREQQAAVCGGRSTLVRPYPISIDWPNRWTESAPSVTVCRTDVRRELGVKPDTLLGVGVDRLDYTKGIEERFLAVERLLERNPEFRGKFTFVQLAAPSRTAIEKYAELSRTVDQLALRINGKFGRGDYRPIILRVSHHEPPTVFRYYRASEVCYVSSLHDGMNLVAKEFVAARDDEQGVLVLSRFTGAAREMTEALLVNPYDLDQASSAIAAALSMSESEQQERMRAMRSLVSEFNVYRWAGRMLEDAGRLRQKDRLSERLETTEGALA